MSNPTLGVWPLQSDLAGQDRTGTVSLTGVDPTRFESGLWLEEGEKSFVSNPVAGNGTTDYSCTGAVFSLATDVLPGPLPYDYLSSVTSCIKSTAIATTTAFSTVVVSQTLDLSGSGAGAGAYVGSALVWVPSSVSSTEMQIYRRNFTDATGDLTVALDMTKRDQWQIAQIGFSVVTDVFGEISIRDVSGGMLTGQSVYSILMQCTKGGYRTSPVAGSLGLGYGWTNAAHGSFSYSTRAASSASVPTAGIISPNSGSLAFRATPTIETGLEEIWGECGVKAASTDHVRWGRDATKHPFVEWSSNDAAYQRLTATETIDAGVETFLYLGHDGTDTSLQVGAGTLQTGTRAVVSDSFGAGPIKLQASAGGNVVGPLATYDRFLDDVERSKVRNAIEDGADLFGILVEGSGGYFGHTSSHGYGKMQPTPDRPFIVPVEKPGDWDARR